MWALPMRYPGHFPQYTHDIIMELLLKIHYYLPTLYSLFICLPYIHLYLLTLIPYNLPILIPYYPICIFKNNNGFLIETPLLYPGCIEGNDLGNAWEVPTLFGLEVGLSHQRQLYIVGRIVGSFPQ